MIACDGTRQAGIGDTVYMIGRAEAALMLSREAPPPTDALLRPLAEYDALVGGGW